MLIAPRLLAAARTEPAVSAAVRVATLGTSSMFALANTHLLLAHLGASVFAFIALIISLSALLPFADLGLGGAITTAVAESSNPGRDPRVRDTVTASLRILIAIATTMMVAAAAVGAAERWEAFLGAAVGGPGTDRSVTMAVVLFAASIPFGAGQRLLLGAGRNRVLVGIQGLTAPLTLLGTLILLATGGGPATFAIPPAAAALVVAVIATVAGLRECGLAARRVVRGVFSQRRLRAVALRATAVPLLIIMVGVPLGLLTDRFVLSHRSTVLQLAEYSVVAQLYSALYAVVGAAGAALWPFFIKRRTITSARPVLRKVIILFAAASTLGGTALVVFGPKAVQFISAGELDPGTLTYLAFATLLVVQATHYPSGTFLTSPAGLRFQAWCVALMLPANLFLSWHLAARMGAPGPALASAVTVLALQLIPTMRRALGTEATLHQSL